ncbi:MAG: DUF2723 domain-containing protein [Chloroflexota bacterium]
MTKRLLFPVQALRREQLIGPGLVLASLSLYMVTLAPTVLEADAGEFQFVPWLPGIAHPTGYPLYTLLGWAWSHALVAGEVAWRLNLLSAALAAVTIGLLYGLARQWLAVALPDTPPAGQTLGAAGVALFFALTPTFWSQALVAEVYSLHSLLLTAILWLALRWREQQCDLQSRTGYWLTLTIGLSLTHHRTTVLLLPALALLWWLRRPAGRPLYNRRTWAGHGLLLVLPLLLYLYLPLIAPFTPYATLRLSQSQVLTLYDNSWRGFWQHVLGSVFSGAVQPTSAGPERLGLAWQLMRQEIGWPGILLAAFGLASLGQRRRLDLLGLTGLSWAAFVAFNLVYFIGDVFVLFIPAWLILSLWLGLGALALSRRLAAGFVRGRTGYSEPPFFEALNRHLEQGIYRLVLLALIIGFLFVAIVFMITQNGLIDQSHNTAARSRWQQILAEPLPQGAVLLSNDRNEIMPLWYYQYVQGRRPDLLGLFPLIVTDPAYASVGGVLAQALASGRPVYLIKPMAGLSLKADLSPVGSLFRATAIAAEPAVRYDQTLPELQLESGAGETIRLLGYDLTPRLARPGEQIAVNLYWQPVRPLTVDYTSYVHLIDSTGAGITQHDHRPGGEYYPSHLWQVGERLRDQHPLLLPAGMSPGEYRLRVGLYYQLPSGEIKGMGPGAEIGRLTVR